MPKSCLLAFLIRELKELLPPTVLFAISFNLNILTAQLILAGYPIHFLSFLVATTSALVVGKSVLLADVLPFFRRFDTAPMIQSILFKTIVYWSVVSWRNLSNTGSAVEPSAGSRTTSRIILPGTGLPLSRSGSSFCS
jgi:hypothetical protein